jgi:CBS domain-containing protein
MLVRDVMTTSVITVSPDTPVKVAAKELTMGGFTALPVVADGQLVGIVTEADLVRGHIRQGARSADPSTKREPAAPATTVGALMTSDVITTTPLTDVVALAALMINRRVRSVPVRNGKRLVGIVSRRDLLGTLTESDVVLAAVVRQTLEMGTGPERWGVEVRQGVVRISDYFDDEPERENARALVAAVPGVLHVEVVALDQG